MKRPANPESVVYTPEPSNARCRCARSTFCPRHHVAAYALYEAKHKAAAA